MTVHYTTNYRIAYIDDDSALADLIDASKQAASTTDAALGRGGIAPPDATTQAQLAARITALEGHSYAYGLVARNNVTAGPTTDGTATEQRMTGTINTAVVLTAGRAYRVRFRTRATASTANAQVTVKVRGHLSPSTPATITDPCIASWSDVHTITGSPGAHDYVADGVFTVATSSTYFLSPFVVVSAGTATLIPDSRGVIDLTVEDIGPASVDTGLVKLT